MQPPPPPLDLDEPTLLVGVSQTYRDGMTSCAIYRAARYAWHVHERSRCGLVLAVANNRIVGAFRVNAWLPATREHFPDEEPNPGRSPRSRRPIEPTSETERRRSRARRILRLGQAGAPSPANGALQYRA